ECYYCKRDLPLYCENFHSLGCNAPGGFAEYVAVNGSKLFHISDSLSFDKAAFAEPTACAIHGMDSIDVQNGDSVLMFGSGPTGIILAQLIKCGGAGRVVVAARSEFKLQILEDLGIETVLIDNNNPTAHVKTITDMEPQGFDIVVDATGSPAVLQDCFQYLKKGAKLVIYGVCDESDKVIINPYNVFANEYKIIGSFAQVNCFDRALNAIERGIVKVDKLITDEFSLLDYEKALKTVMNGKSSLKVMIHPNERSSL
ncbi:MAG: zinc-binding dehydrogenase, partial [Ruminiclostridium sp.]